MRSRFPVDEGKPDGRRTGLPGKFAGSRKRLRGWQPREWNGLAQQQREHHARREATNADRPLAEREARDADRANAQSPISPATVPGAHRSSAEPTADRL